MNEIQEHVIMGDLASNPLLIKVGSVWLDCDPFTCNVCDSLDYLILDPRHCVLQSARIYNCDQDLVIGMNISKL